MKKYIVTSFAAAALLMAGSCDTDFENDVLDVVPTSGSADFSRYVAIGNSLTSGYRDNALYADGQLESFPSMVAAQMQRAGGGAFKQPMMPNNVGGFTGLGIAGKLTLQVVNGALSPVPSAPGGPLDNISGGGPYNNLGVPGAKSYHLVAEGYGNQAGLAVGKANPYFVRFASEPNTSVLKDAMKQKPTFFSLWIGNNDVLAYATSGGVGVDRKGNPDASTYGPNDISDPQLVAGVIKSMLDGLKSVGSTKGVIANIPDVSAIPYFTTIPFNPLTAAAIGKGDVAAGTATIATLNTSLYGPLKQALTAIGAGDRLNLLNPNGANPLLIKDVSLPNKSAELTAALTPALGAATAAAFGQIYGQARQTTTEDFVLLPTQSVIGTTAAGAPATINAYGISYPLENQHVLTKKESENVKAAVAAYNGAISQLAASYGLALVDANARMNELNKKSGMQYDGVRYTATFVTGGAFSLDGVHLTGRGYAIVANDFITAINAKYGSTLPLVNANQYSGVTFP